MSATAYPALSARPLPATSRTQWIVLGADALALEMSFGLALLLRGFLSRWLPAQIGLEQYVGIGVTILLLPLVNFQLGLYPGYLIGPVERLRRRALATIAMFGALVAWDTFFSRGVLSRGILLLTFGFALILPPLAETATRAFLIRRGRWGISVVLLGAQDTGRALARTLLREQQLGLKPIAFLDNHPEFWNKSIEGIPVAGPLGFATGLEYRAEAAIVCVSDLDRADTDGLLQELRFPRVIVLPELAGVTGLWVTARDLGGHMGFEIKKNLLVRRNHTLKLFMDQMVALPLFVLSLPIIGVAALWIKLVSPGPAFYRQFREGIHGRRIAVWKLRTMYLDGDQILEHWFGSHPEDRTYWQQHFKLPEDPRVLPVIGHWLRRTSLDELPQLWSVLRGEMSLVGPRPLPNYHLEQFSSKARALRAKVLPGLTGLWQVSARGDGDVELHQSLDSFYIRNWSLWLDIYILVRTISAVFLARGAY